MKSVLIPILAVFSFNAFAQSPGAENDPMIPNSGPKEKVEQIQKTGGAIQMENKPAVPPDAVDHNMEDHDSFTKNQKDRLMKEKKAQKKNRKKGKHKRKHHRKQHEGHSQH